MNFLVAISRFPIHARSTTATTTTKITSSFSASYFAPPRNIRRRPSQEPETTTAIFDSSESLKALQSADNFAFIGGRIRSRRGILTRKGQQGLALLVNMMSWSTSVGGSGGEGEKNLSEFLASQKLKLMHHNDGEKARHISLGNPAGDCDSIVSSIAVAYIYSLQRKSDSGILPIISIPERSLKTQRPETSLLMKWAGISVDDLICIDQFSKLSDTDSQRLQITLVDHNKLDLTANPCFSGNEFEVIEILDHHLDEGKHIETCPPTSGKRTIAFDKSVALVASTCTLMVERYLAGTGQHQPSFPTDLAILLLGTILLDSVNLSPKAKKVTQRDIDATQALVEHTNWSTLALSSPDMLSEGLLEEIEKGKVRPNCSKWFDTLQNQKFSKEFWNQLTVYDCLALDYKSFTTTASNDEISFGMASILTPLTNFFSKISMEEQILNFVNEQNNDIKILVIMSCVSNPDSGELQRELALAATKDNIEVFDSVLKYLQSSDAGKALQLEPFSLTLPGVDHDEDQTCEVTTRITKNEMKLIAMKQLNSGMSRKQVAPVLLDFFEKHP